MSGVGDYTWLGLFPDGRHLYYEGDDPGGFSRMMREKFGFDPETDPDWSEERGWGFYCPGELLDEVYGKGYHLGS